MPPYFFLYLPIASGIVFLLVRHFILKRSALATRLFIKGTIAENNGRYDEATSAYEQALAEAEKTGFHHGLKRRITEKLKIMHTVRGYESEQNFVRENDSWIN